MAIGQDPEYYDLVDLESQELLSSSDDSCFKELSPTKPGKPSKKKPGKSSAFWAGLFCATVSGLLFTINNTIIKEHHLNGTDTILVRSLFQVLVFALIICYKGYNVLFGWTKLQGLAILQGLSSALTLVCAYQAIKFLPLGDAMTILFSSPLFAVALERCFFKTAITKWKVFSMSILSIGVILVAKPDVANLEFLLSHDFFGILAAFGAAISGALNLILMGCTKDDMELSVIQLYGGTFQILTCFIATWIDANDLVLSGQLFLIPKVNWLWMGVVSVLGVLAFATVTMASKRLPPAIVSFIRSLEITFAYIVDICFFGRIPDLSSGLGASLVMISVVISGVEAKQKQTKVTNNKD